MKKIIFIIGILTFLVSCASVFPTSIKVSVDKSTLKVGDSVQLKVTVTPENSQFLYGSSHPAIATVSETGLVKAIAPGTVNIGAGVGDLYDQVTLVIEEAENPYTSLIITPNTRQFEIGQTVIFGFSYLPLTLPSPPVEWKIENTDIALFDQSVLTIQAAGTTKVWAEITIDGQTVKSNVVDISVTLVDENDVTLGSESYALAHEIKMSEGSVIQVWPQEGILWSIDEATGILTHKGGSTISGENAASVGSNYNESKAGVGANSWLVWSFPPNINPVEYDYIEIDYQRKSVNPPGGYSIIFNHSQPYPGAMDRSGGISYEMVHFNNDSNTGYGWFISYGGMWQNVGKQIKYHAGVGRPHPRNETDVVRFGMRLTAGPQSVSLFYNRANGVHYNSYGATQGPQTWVENGSTVLELIYNAAHAGDCTVAIEKVRLYTRKVK